MGPFELLAIMYNTDIPSISMPETKEVLEKQRGKWDWSRGIEELSKMVDMTDEQKEQSTKLQRHYNRLKMEPGNKLVDFTTFKRYWRLGRQAFKLFRLTMPKETPANIYKLMEEKLSAPTINQKLWDANLNLVLVKYQGVKGEEQIAMDAAKKAAEKAAEAKEKAQKIRESGVVESQKSTKTYTLRSRNKRSLPTANSTKEAEEAEEEENELDRALKDFAEKDQVAKASAKRARTLEAEASKVVASTTTVAKSTGARTKQPIESIFAHKPCDTAEWNPPLLSAGPSGKLKHLAPGKKWGKAAARLLAHASSLANYLSTAGIWSVRTRFDALMDIALRSNKISLGYKAKSFLCLVSRIIIVIVGDNINHAQETMENIIKEKLTSVAAVIAAEPNFVKQVLKRKVKSLKAAWFVPLAKKS